MFHDLDASLRAAPDRPHRAAGDPRRGHHVPDAGQDVHVRHEGLNLFLTACARTACCATRCRSSSSSAAASVRRTPPLRVDCDYLVTAWSKEAGAAGVAGGASDPGPGAGSSSPASRSWPPATCRERWWASRSRCRSGWRSPTRQEPRGILDRARRAAPIVVPPDRDCRDGPAGPVPDGPPVSTSTIIVDDDLLPSTPERPRGRSAVRSGGSPTVRRSSARPSRSTGTGPGRPTPTAGSGSSG